LVLSLSGKVVSGLGGYQRGVGSYVVRYSARSYNNAKWEPVTIGNDEPKKKDFDVLDSSDIKIENIGGWDKNNFAVTCNTGLYWFHNEKWQKFYCYYDIPYFLNANQFVINNRIYDETGYKESFEELNRNEKWAAELRFSACPYIAGKAIGLSSIGDIYGFVQGKRSEETKQKELYTNQNIHGKIMWAKDEKNFIVANNYDITVVRNGEIKHPTMMHETFDRGKVTAVWGASLDLFWLMDKNGNIAEFKNGQAGNQVFKSDLKDEIRDTWISPEGTVFSVSGDKLYRLD
jgi:hypothetical protein